MLFAALLLRWDSPDLGWDTGVMTGNTTETRTELGPDG
jgi:hypothetical protein